MGLNETPSAARVHIGFFGRRNTGKSSLVNAVTGQELAVVSDIKGTTTDPVYKAMELLPLGPVVIIDTPGFDDEGKLGELRVNRTRQVLNKTDVAVLVIEAGSVKASCFSSTKTGAGKGTKIQSEDEIELCEAEQELIGFFKDKKIPYIVAVNKCDLISGLSFCDKPGCHNIQITNKDTLPSAPCCPVLVSAKTGYNINLLKETIAALAVTEESGRHLVADLIKPLDTVVLVIPIDKAAPKGRLILPQQQVIRDILEAGAVAVVVRDSELREVLAGAGNQPALVITDSQVFAHVSALVPDAIALTSFSILFARYKGALEASVRGVQALDSLRSGDTILICEGCTHHRQCDDIGTVKLPRMIQDYTGTELQFCFCSGGDFPADLSSYAMIIHCGACMLNDREMQYRRRCAGDQHIPFTNYGITIAHIQGILRRSIAMFGITS